METLSRQITHWQARISGKNWRVQMQCSNSSQFTLNLHQLHINPSTFRQAFQRRHGKTADSANHAGRPATDTSQFLTQEFQQKGCLYTGTDPEFLSLSSSADQQIQALIPPQKSTPGKRLLRLVVEASGAYLTVHSTWQCV